MLARRKTSHGLKRCVFIGPSFGNKSSCELGHGVHSRTQASVQTAACPYFILLDCFPSMRKCWLLDVHICLLIAMKPCILESFPEHDLDNSFNPHKPQLSWKRTETFSGVSLRLLGANRAGTALFSPGHAKRTRGVNTPGFK